MKQCPNCKSTFPDGQAFCTNCGTMLADAQPSGAEEPTILIPPIQGSGGVPAGDPFADTQSQIPASAPPPPPPPPPSPPQTPVQTAAKPSKAPVIVAVVLAVCTVLAAGCAGLFGYQALQMKNNYAAERELRMDAQLEASDLQEELDKLRLDCGKAESQLEEVQAQLEDAQSQLEDVSGQLTDGSSQLGQVRQELDSLVNMLDRGYGFGSTSYYASKGVVVVDRNGSETISIYEDLAGSTTFTFHTPGYGVDCAWNGSFSGGRATATFTGQTAGYYTVSFTNDANSDSFDILVIVTE